MKFTSRCLKVYLQTSLNVYIVSWDGFWFLTKRFSVCKSWSYAISISGTNLIFSLTFINVWLMLIQNDIYCWMKTTTWIDIEEFRQNKFYNNIGDFSIRSFWYYRNDSKRNPWDMLCWQCSINDSFGYLLKTVYAEVMLKASWRSAEGNWESKCLYIKPWWISKTS